MKSSLHSCWRRMANGVNRSGGALLAVALLSPLALCYGLIQRCRAFLYDRGIFRARTLPRPVISIGNITVGGTGKTPVTAWLAAHLLDQGYQVAVLSRGYGGSLEGSVSVVSDGQEILLDAAECGDEPYLLATTIPGLMVVIGSDRHAAGMLAMERLHPDLFLLDDGFQHLRLHRDLNILLLDAEHPFGNGLCLPAGLMREPCSAARRADWIIHTRCTDKVVNIPLLTPVPQADARHTLRDLLPLGGGPALPLSHLKGKKVLAFAGIAEPGRFFDDLRNAGAELVRTVPLPDHAGYDAATMALLREELTASGAALAVTTEKDAVKLTHSMISGDAPVMAARLGLTVDGGGAIVGDLLNLLQKK